MSPTKICQSHGVFGVCCMLVYLDRNIDSCGIERTGPSPSPTYTTAIQPADISDIRTSGQRLGLRSDLRRLCKPCFDTREPTERQRGLRQSRAHARSSTIFCAERARNRATWDVTRLLTRVSNEGLAQCPFDTV